MTGVHFHVSVIPETWKSPEQAEPIERVARWELVLELKLEDYPSLMRSRDIGYALRSQSFIGLLPTNLQIRHTVRSQSWKPAIFIQTFHRRANCGRFCVSINQRRALSMRSR